MTPQGSYRTMDFTELIEAYDRLAEAAKVFRPIVHTEDPDPAAAVAPIYQAAIGPDQVSSCTELQPVSDLPVWDVNAYYRAVGIEWPYRPTRAVLREAYQASGGPGSHYATYALKRLLDGEFRAHYDRRALGQPVDDRYLWEALYRMASDWASKQSEATGRVVKPTDLIGGDIKDRMAAEVEAEQQEAERRASGREERPRVIEDEKWVWPYAYYHWGSRHRDERTLARWQGALVSAFSRTGLRVMFAVGYMGKPGAARVRHRKPDGEVIDILFLGQDEEPAPSLADIVVGTYQNHPHGSDLPEPLLLSAD